MWALAGVCICVIGDYVAVNFKKKSLWRSPTIILFPARFGLGGVAGTPCIG